MSIKVGKQNTFQNLFNIIKPKIEGKQDKQLSSSIAINGVSETTVEGAINGLDNRLKKSTTPVIETRVWVNKIWNWTPTDGSCIWSDGTDIYYSLGNIQKKFDKNTNIWIDKSWNYKPSGDDIWTDGNNIYFSNMCILNKNTQRWDYVEWAEEVQVISGEDLWTDGSNIYFSQGETQKQINTTTYTWSDKTWTGLTDFYAYNIWSDGINIYYSDSNIQKILTGSTWSNMTWQGSCTTPLGDCIWTDGNNIYYDKYILDKYTNTWNLDAMETEMLEEVDINRYLWTDGNNIYYSNDNHPSSGTKVLSKKKMLSTKTI